MTRSDEQEMTYFIFYHDRIKVLKETSNTSESVWREKTDWTVPNQTECKCGHDLNEHSMNLTHCDPWDKPYYCDCIKFEDKHETEKMSRLMCWDGVTG
jgi:hypothetical protein